MDAVQPVPGERAAGTVHAVVTASEVAPRLGTIQVQDQKEPLVNRVGDKARRAQLDEAYQQTEVPLIQATQAGHAFVYDELKERLSTARQRLEALLGQLANPTR